MSTLNQVIKRVNKKEELKTNQSLFVINEKNGEIVNNWFSKAIGKNIRYYVVSNANLARNSAEGETGVIPVKDFQDDREIGLIIHYYVQCPSGKEERLVRSLYREASPEEALVNIIENIVLNHINLREAEFIDNYASERDTLNAIICKQIESITGLIIKVQIHLKYEDCLSTLQILERSIPVQLKEGIEEHSITFSLDSEPDLARVVHAVMAYPDLHLMEDKLVRSIQSFFKTKVPYQVFHDGFRDVTSNENFNEMLKIILYDEGRRPAKWKIDPHIKGGRASEFETFSISIQRTPYQANGSISIKNELQMILKDAAKLKSSGVSDFKHWIEDTLERIIEEEVFEMKYLQFLLEFSPKVEGRIRERMKNKAELIGYEVKHLISRPDMKEEVYLKARPYEFNYNNLPTREDGLDINLGVAVTFSISDLNKVADWLNKNIDLESIIERSIKLKLEQILHGETPETVYMKFHIVDPKLSDAVKAHLEEEYHAVVIGSPIIKSIDTEISSFANNLIDTTQDFSVSIVPFGKREHLPTFHGKFTITSINDRGWSRIKKMDFTIDQVKSFFVDSLKAHFGSLPYDELLLYDTPKLRMELEKKANEISRLALVERYGVDVAIDNFYRDPVELEKQKVKVLEQRGMHDLKKVKHLIDRSNTAIENTTLLVDKESTALLNQAKILHEKKEECLKSMDPLADGEESEQIKQITQMEKDLLKKDEMDQSVVDQLSAGIDEKSNHLPGLPSIDSMLPFAGVKRKPDNTDDVTPVEQAEKGE